MNATDPTPPEAPANGLRKKRLLILGAVVLVAGIAYGAYQLLHARFYESTDDAYVAADVMQITSEVSGTVTAVFVDDTQHVQRGQPLVELDRADAEIAMASAQAELARTVRQVRALFSQADGLRAQIRERSVLLDAARADVKRREQAGQDGAVSAEEMQHVRDQEAQLAASLASTRDSLASTQAQIEGTTLETHPQVLAASARVREAALALSRTRIVAPADGTVARRTVQIGTRIAPGAPLMAVAALSGAWVDANFKEVQLADIRIGQPVELHADLYGGDVTYHGHIAGLGAGSGSAFAVLPAQNASGNWIKIVQRVPVRIALDPKELVDHPLRIGLSMDVTVDLHDTSGPLVAQQVRATPRQLAVSDDGNAAVARQIASIISANAGRPETGAAAP
ncbi:MAG TPA: efflux RND transporter periplasmic adaptor subunit [Steroidobacteraceae bacterium]|jgi:membrane fusion protein (multidrug efflux system)